VLVVLYSVPALFWTRDCIRDPDIWWHIRTGQWILEHHAVPRVDPFSSFAAGKPWAAYSWLFEVVVAKLYSLCGLLSFVVYTAGLAVLITSALHRLVRRLQPDFSLAALLALVGAMSLGHLYTPRPWLVTILFFLLELDILMQVRRTGRTRPLLWLPLLFAVWANVHIQFIDGLVVLALAAAESIAAALIPRWPGLSTHLDTRVSARMLCSISAACLAATCLNPSGPRIFEVAHELAAQPGVFNLITELKAVPFRDFTDFLLLLLTLAACALLARAPRLILFELALFAFAAFVSFRSQRDVWVMSAVAITILASRLRGSARAQDRLPAAATALCALAACLVVTIGFATLHVSNSSLRKQLAASMPVDAVNFVRSHHLAGPLYNDFNWGGYLIGNLGMPVSIDGRAALMGDEHIERSVNSIDGRPGWSSDQALAAAGLVILPADAPLAQLLLLDPRFLLAYRDKVAIVFTRQHG
jgi:hypothetical protein